MTWMFANTRAFEQVNVGALNQGLRRDSELSHEVHRDCIALLKRLTVVKDHLQFEKGPEADNFVQVDAGLADMDHRAVLLDHPANTDASSKGFVKRLGIGARTADIR